MVYFLLLNEGFYAVGHDSLGNSFGYYLKTWDGPFPRLIYLGYVLYFICNNVFVINSTEIYSFASFKDTTKKGFCSRGTGQGDIGGCIYFRVGTTVGKKTVCCVFNKQC